MCLCVCLGGGGWISPGIHASPKKLRKFRRLGATVIESEQSNRFYTERAENGLVTAHTKPQRLSPVQR